MNLCKYPPNYRYHLLFQQALAICKTPLLALIKNICIWGNANPPRTNNERAGWPQKPLPLVFGPKLVDPYPDPHSLQLPRQNLNSIAHYQLWLEHSQKSKNHCNTVTSIPKPLSIEVIHKCHQSQFRPRFKSLLKWIYIILYFFQGPLKFQPDHFLYNFS